LTIPLAEKSLAWTAPESPPAEPRAAETPAPTPPFALADGDNEPTMVVKLDFAEMDAAAASPPSHDVAAPRVEAPTPLQVAQCPRSPEPTVVVAGDLPVGAAIAPEAALPRPSEPAVPPAPRSLSQAATRRRRAGLIAAGAALGFIAGGLTVYAIVSASSDPVALAALEPVRLVEAPVAAALPSAEPAAAPALAAPRLAAAPPAVPTAARAAPAPRAEPAAAPALAAPRLAAAPPAVPTAARAAPAARAEPPAPPTIRAKRRPARVSSRKKRRQAGRRRFVRARRRARAKVALAAEKAPAPAAPTPVAHQPPSPTVQAKLAVLDARGTYHPRSLHQRLLPSRRNIDRCWEAAQPAQLLGRLVGWRIEVSSQGSVRSVQPVDPALGDSLLGLCMKSVLEAVPWGPTQDHQDGSFAIYFSARILASR
jgi:hypothetical protein